MIRKTIYAATLCVTAAPEVMAQHVSVDDVIAQVQFDSRIALSPDGKAAAVFAWHGDRTRNVNVYRLYVFDIAKAVQERRLPEHIAELTLANDSLQYDSQQLDQLQLHVDSKTGGLLATFLFGRPLQVHRANAATRRVDRLTNHPRDIRAYGIGLDGSLSLFAAIADDSTDQSDGERTRRVLEEGAFVTDTASIAPSGTRLRSAVLFARDQLASPGTAKVYEYFSIATRRARPKRIFATERVNETILVHRVAPVFMSVSPNGRTALLWPYTRSAARADFGANRFGIDGMLYYGLVDLRSGGIITLPIDRPAWFNARPDPYIRSRDGARVFIHGRWRRQDESSSTSVSAQWLELDPATHRISEFDVLLNWHPLAFDSAGGVLLLKTDRLGRGLGTFAARDRTPNGWGALRELGSIGGLLSHDGDSAREDFIVPLMGAHLTDAVSNGRFVVGIAENRLAPPELAVHDMATGMTTVISGVNGALRSRRFGHEQTFRWQSPNDSSEAAGCLVLPRDGAPRGGYPMVVMLARNNCKDPRRPWFRLYGPDGTSAVPTHTLAAHGIAVFFLRDPRLATDLERRERLGESEAEGRALVADFESAMRAMAAAGFVDTTRVGVTGWSRGGFWTDYLLTHSVFPVAAASKIDGGNANYLTGKAWTPEELRRMRPPMLIEAVGQPSADVVEYGLFADQLRELGKAVELLWFPLGPHPTITPTYRWKSMHAHTDWFRFWLQGYEDSDPAKAAQYARWRKLRKPQ